MLYNQAPKKKYAQAPEVTRASLHMWWWREVVLLGRAHQYVELFFWLILERVRRSTVYTMYEMAMSFLLATLPPEVSFFFYFFFKGRSLRSILLGIAGGFPVFFFPLRNLRSYEIVTARHLNMRRQMSGPRNQCSTAIIDRALMILLRRGPGRPKSRIFLVPFNFPPPCRKILCALSRPTSVQQPVTLREGPDALFI